MTIISTHSQSVLILFTIIVMFYVTILCRVLYDLNVELDRTKYITENVFKSTNVF